MAILVSIKGRFSIEINEGGLDIDNPEHIEICREDILELLDDMTGELNVTHLGKIKFEIGEE